MPLDRSGVFNFAVSARTTAGLDLTKARKALADAIAPEALALNDNGTADARKAAEDFLYREARFREARNVVLALEAYIKAPPAEPSEPHTVTDSAEVWGVGQLGHVARWLGNPDEARTLAQKLSEGSDAPVFIRYFASSTPSDEGALVEPEGPWATVPDDLMRPAKES